MCSLEIFFFFYFNFFHEFIARICDKNKVFQSPAAERCTFHPDDKVHKSWMINLICCNDDSKTQIKQKMYFQVDYTPDFTIKQT